MRVLLVAKDSTKFSVLTARLLHLQEIELVTAATGTAGLTQLLGKPIDVVIVDEHLSDTSGIAFVKKLVKSNPLVNTTIVSALTAEKFHEATEGLGVLMQMSIQPQAKDAEALLAILEKIGILLEPTATQSQKVEKS